MIDEIKQINPKHWGKSYWIFLNSLGLVFLPEKKTDYKIFFSKLGDLLPCDLCSSHYNTFLPKLDVALESKHTLIDWLLEIRNDINIKSNKPILTISDIIQEIYFNNYNSNPNQTNYVTTETNNQQKLNNLFLNKIPKKLFKFNIFDKKNILFILILFLIIFIYQKIKSKKLKNNNKK